MRQHSATLLPLYIRIKESIIKQILQSNLQVGDRLPSEREIARENGVAHLTARKAVEALIQDGIVKREYNRRAYVARLICPVDGASQKKQTFHARVTVFRDEDDAPPHLNGFRTGLGRILDGLLKNRGYEPVYRNVGRDALLNDEQLEELTAPGMQAAVMFNIHSEEIARQLWNSGITSCCIDFAPVTVPIDGVVTDNIKIVSKAMDHLWRLGHRNIGFLGHYSKGRKDVDAVEMSFFFQNYFEQKEYQNSSRYCRFCSTNIQHLIQEATYFSELSNPPTALFISSESLARGFRAELQRFRISVPENLSIVTKDGGYHKTGVKFTSILIDWYELIRSAVDRIEEQIEGSTIPGIRISHAGELVDRNTTLPIQYSG